MSSDFSTKTSMPVTGLDHDAGYCELQPQVRILRRYRAASTSPPSAKRRAAAMQNGTRRPSPAAGGAVDVLGIVDVDCTTSTAHVRSLPVTPLPPPKTCTMTTNAAIVAFAATTTTTTSAVKTMMFTAASTTTTPQKTATNKSSLLVETQTSNNARTTYSTFNADLDVRLPLDGLQQPSGTDSDREMYAKRRKFGKPGKKVDLNVDAVAAAATRGRRWRIRRQAVVGRPLTEDTQTPKKSERRLRRCVGCLKNFVAFLFSTIGLTILLIGYTIIGGFVFRFIEAPREVG